MNRWPFCSMPPWFAEAFEGYARSAHILNDYRLPAENFWLQILRHEEFPTPERPKLSGHEGWRYICPIGMLDGRGHSLRWAGQDSTDQRTYWCEDCQKLYALMDDLKGKFEEVA